VQYCYEPNEEGREGQNWRRLSNNVVVNNTSQELVYYQTELTIHLFMVRHPNSQEDKNNWCYLRNMAVVEFLKQILLNCNPRRFNILKEFISSSEMLLNRYQYLKGWNDTFCVKLKEEGGKKLILPCQKTSEQSLSFDLGSPRSARKDEGVEFDRNRLQITDIGEVITEGQSRLQGNVATTPKEHIIHILVPGVTDLGAISFKFEGWHTISIYVVLPFLLPISKEPITKENTIRRDLCGGNSFFRHTFPESLPFRRPATQEEMSELISVEGGILKIRLKREGEVEVIV